MGQGKYDNNKEFTALVEDACRKIADDFRFLRDERLSLKVNMDFNGRQELRTIAPIYLLQDIYTNDMTIFRKMINREQRKIFRENYAKTGHPFGEEKSTIDVLNRNGVLAKQNPETVMQLLNLLDGQEVDFHKRYSTLSVEAQVILIKLEQEKLKNSIEFPHIIDYKDNPFTSTGFTNKAAFDYSIENKTYGSYLLQEFFPNYDNKLVPQHPYMGKLYGFMMSEAQYKDYVAESAMNVVEQHEKGRLRINQDIIDENEMTFIGGCIVTEEPRVKVSKYPKFKKEWDDLTPEKQVELKKEYGLDKLAYGKIKKGLLALNEPKHNPAYLRDEFTTKYAALLNVKKVAKNEKSSTFNQPWTKEEVFILIANEALNKDMVEATLKSYGGSGDKASQECIAILTEYSKAKKEFHGLFKNVYEHMLDKFEQDSIDFALNRGFKIANLSEKGKSYQEKRMAEVSRASVTVHIQELEALPKTLLPRKHLHEKPKATDPMEVEKVTQADKRKSRRRKSI